MKTTTHILLGSSLVIILATFLAVLSFTNGVSVGGAAEPNMHARTHAMSTTSVGIYTASTIATGIEPCASRVITTNDRLYLSFDPNVTPTGLLRGVYQAASTTVAYDSSLFGCGDITAIASATTTVTVTTFKF